MKKFFFLILVLALTSNVDCQDLNDFLSKVSDHNPQILAYEKLLEAKKVEAKSGLTPPDPFISGSFMPGRDQTTGNKRTWAISQSFSFPVKYLFQNKLNKNTFALAEQEYFYGRLQIMLDAEVTLLELIYNKKLLAKAEERRRGYDELSKAWRTMLDNGAATIMDYNSIIVELAEVKYQTSMLQSTINMLEERINYLAGSQTVNIGIITEYPAFPELNLEQVIEEKRISHPAYIIPEAEYQLSVSNIKLNKASSLPELQIGYGAELIPGENFAGLSGGMSIPLWSNNNNIKVARAESEYYESLFEAKVAALDSEVKNKFTNMLALKNNFEELDNLSNSGESKTFLDKALQSGEISLTTYFSYLRNIYEAEDRLLKVEFDFYRSVATLLDHQLLNY